MKFIPFYFLIITLLVFSCNKSPEEEICTDTPDVYMLLSDTLSEYIVNYEEASRVIFHDSIGEEFYFTIDTTQQWLGFGASVPCIEDTTKDVFRWNYRETNNYILNNDIFEQPIQVRVKFVFGTDYLSVEYGNDEDAILMNDNEFLFGLTISPQNEEIEFRILDSIQLNNNWFYNVFEMKTELLNSLPPIEIKYTKEQGIIYIRDTITNHVLVYNRVE